MTAVPASRTGLFAALLGAEPVRVLCVTNGGREITAGQVRRAGQNLAKRIGAQGGTLYVFTPGVAELAAALLASLILGAKPVLLPQAGKAYCQSISAPPERCVGQFAGFGHAVEISAQPDADWSEPPALPDAPMLGFYTSGSSGDAKLLEKPLDVLEAEALYWTGRLAGQFSHVTGSVSHQHIYGFLFRFLLPVLSGTRAANDLALSWDGLFAGAPDDTLLVSSPAHLTRIAPDEVIGDYAASVILSSGGPLPLEAALEVNRIFGKPPIEILGSTETGGIAWRQRFEDDPAWRALEAVAVDIDSEGALTVRSPFIPGGGPVQTGDVAEFLPDGRFILKGRADLVVKVEGKRVSLTRVTDTLLAHDWIEDGLALITETGGRERLSAVLVPTEAGRAQLAQLGSFRFSRQLAASLASTLEPAETPKRWRFVAGIPVNAQSKRSRPDLARLFEADRMLDLLKPQIEANDAFDAKLGFIAHADLPWFRGHFPGTPILPGLAQVHIAERLAEELWAVRPDSHNVSRLKFNRVIQPGETVQLSLSFRQDTGKLTFKYTSADEQISSGTIG